MSPKESKQLATRVAKESDNVVPVALAERPFEWLTVPTIELLTDERDRLRHAAKLHASNLEAQLDKLQETT
jgi:hypothetical protein